MIINRYAGIKGIFRDIKMVKKIQYLTLRPKMNKYIDRQFWGGFNRVEIETINRCNNNCPFCPVSAQNEKREFAKMNEGLFIKILDDLAEMKYAGKLALYSNNEPLLDDRLISFAKIAREKCPDAFLYIYTNGKLLTEEKLLGLLQYLDKVVIDNYNDSLELNPSSLMADALCKKNPELDKKIEIHLRKQNEVLFSRGGNAPNKKSQKTLDMPCIFPFCQLIIRPDGKVSLCCNDAYGNFTMGDCNTMSLMEIWNSENYRKVRDQLMKGRQNVSLCKFCDTV